ncbi:hypothetical protein KEM55_006316 [Ascosphaera atra]|nr:hypothetical protein KEM55_006316 [Ascosphaera atra]
MPVADTQQVAETVPAVKTYKRVINELLDTAGQIKATSSIEPPLTENDFGDAITKAYAAAQGELGGLKQQGHWDAVETVSRGIFYHLLATTSIDDPSFVRIWNLLDLLSIFSDNEDTVFCGRVFIYLFQSFPLGDKSSVNLRGEFHTENVTTFDEAPVTTTGTVAADAMDVDNAEGEKAAESETPQQQQETKTEGQEEKKTASAAKEDATKSVDMVSMYPTFWSLQNIFSSPTKLFDETTLANFKQGLESTIAMFRTIRSDVEIRNVPKPSDEQRRGVKRRRIDSDASTADTFNPKYLTSRDLFELEVNDVAFRRHIMVQALIILDFLLSLTPTAKAKLSNSTNKSMLYAFTLSEDDTKWASKTKTAIASYLQDGPGGKFYYRMVDTVLTRDKNWVRWKANGCPLIERPPTSTQEKTAVRTSATKTFASKRLRSTPLGSLDLKFLSEEKTANGMEALKDPERFANPKFETYIRAIADDDFNIDMAQSNEEKEEAMKARSSKAWRTLRLSARNRLSCFERIDDGKNLSVLTQDDASSEIPSQSQKTEANSEATQTQEDSKPAGTNATSADPQQDVVVQKG